MSELIRCAIYTRKSTEEGLDQDFNSLDAQREACEAFVASQKGLGWRVLPKRYDDGGISGGTMERPALQELLADIEQGEVDLVVVYKVDRLTRSLMDFARIIETFDSQAVSVVSVTQQFNTANSMGRLTLNVLLSFAQFEREVTAERIRDKIAASKKKGMWMGGLPPLGYDNIDKKLVINVDEARTVRFLFESYIELDSIRALKGVADQQGITTKCRKVRGGRSFSRGHLAQLLRNPVYIGKVAHHGEVFEGQHEAIIGLETWETVQQFLDGKAPSRRSATNTKLGSLLTGLLFDETDDRLTPTYTKKHGRRYRYYISKRLVGDPNAQDGWRIPAPDLEKTIVQCLTDFLEDEAGWIGLLDHRDRSVAEVKEARRHAAGLLRGLSMEPGEDLKAVVHRAIEKITVTPGTVLIDLELAALFPGLAAGADRVAHTITLPFQMRRRGVEAKIMIPGAKTQSINPDENLTRLMQRSHQWWRQLVSEPSCNVEVLARTSGIAACEVTRFLPLAFLAPDIVEAVLDGRQPVELNVQKLKKLGAIPADWAEQRRLLGVCTQLGQP